VGRDALEVSLAALASELDREAKVRRRPLDLSPRRPQPRAIPVRRGEMKAITAGLAVRDHLAEHALRLVELAEVRERTPEQQARDRCSLCAVRRARIDEHGTQRPRAIGEPVLAKQRPALRELDVDHQGAVDGRRRGEAGAGARRDLLGAIEVLDEVEHDPLVEEGGDLELEITDLDRDGGRFLEAGEGLVKAMQA